MPTSSYQTKPLPDAFGCKSVHAATAPLARNAGYRAQGYDAELNVGSAGQAVRFGFGSEIADSLASDGGSWKFERHTERVGVGVSTRRADLRLDGAWLRTRFELQGERLAITTLEAVPLWTRNNFLDVALQRAERLDIGVGPLTAASAELQAERRPLIERALGGAVTLR